MAAADHNVLAKQPEPSCNVCGGDLGAPVYRPASGLSVTSLCQIQEGSADVFFCRHCGHLQTTELPGIQEYYDRDYRILVDSEEEDQLYEVRDGRIVYRTDHQVTTLLSKVKLPHDALVLDYGCAKAATLRRLAALRPDLTPHMFDVSRMYLPFWQTFARPDNWAVYEVPAIWEGRFDLVTTFFALEHVATPVNSLRTMAHLLRPGGVLYGIVPNVFTNWADFVVIDHVNHFSESSLRRLLLDAGLSPLEIDSAAHTGAFVFRAKRPTEPVAEVSTEPTAIGEEVARIASYWNGLGQRVREFEAALPPDAVLAVYGSGFYGTFIGAALADPRRIRCFIDRNPFRQGKFLLDRPVVAPEALPPGVNTICVGLNPASAHQNIADLGWDARNYRYFFP